MDPKFQRVRIGITNNWGHRTDRQYVSIRNKQNQMIISGGLVSAANLQPGDTVNLYRHKNIFALVPEKDGEIKLRHSNAKSHTLCITRKVVCETVLNAAGKADAYKAWVDSGVIYFDVTEFV